MPNIDFEVYQEALALLRKTEASDEAHRFEVDRLGKENCVLQDALEETEGKWKYSNDALREKMHHQKETIEALKEAVAQHKAENEALLDLARQQSTMITITGQQSKEFCGQLMEHQRQMKEEYESEKHNWLSRAVYYQRHFDEAEARAKGLLAHIDDLENDLEWRNFESDQRADYGCQGGMVCPRVGCFCKRLTTDLSIEDPEMVSLEELSDEGDECDLVEFSEDEDFE